MLYPIAIERGDKDTAHGVIVPDIAGCFSAADDINDIISNATEAISLHLESMVEDGEEIPLPSGLEAHINNPDYAGMAWALVPVDVSRYLGSSEKINVTMPSLLVHKIDEHVASNKALYKSRSGYLATLAERDLITSV